MPGWIPPQPGQSGTPGEHLTVAEEVVKRMAMAGGDGGKLLMKFGVRLCMIKWSIKVELWSSVLTVAIL